MPEATLTSKGQVTIPKKVREFLRLKPRDRLQFLLRDDGTVVVRHADLDVRDLKGLLHRPGMRVVSVDEMKDVVRSRLRSRE